MRWHCLLTEECQVALWAGEYHRGTVTRRWHCELKSAIVALSGDVGTPGGTDIMTLSKAVALLEVGSAILTLLIS